MAKWLKGGILAIIVIIAANAIYVTIPAYLGKGEDPRNANVTMVAHLRWGVDPTTIVIDLLDVNYATSPADVTRTMLDIAKALKGRSFTTAQMAFRGNAKFQMDGSYFRKLGEEREWQNPVYTIRTLPENLRTPDGRPAFGTWTGGWLGVMGKQMEDHNEMHRLWYIKNL